ncbi:unnamed protein product [Phytomonas sp. Hart1]|nr:unnamed protein product [Phytomonas sp. Hart1]|eukprot:CCW66592.1 unnamed protein product [Phytomonas sp. isolate Hart1]
MRSPETPHGPTAPGLPLPVPLITPRHPRNPRWGRTLTLTNVARAPLSANAALHDRATETLAIRAGPHRYAQALHFHAYGLYKPGGRQLHRRSLGYSPEGDLVLTREDYSETSDGDLWFTPRCTLLSQPTVLDPAARRPMTDTELALTSTRRGGWGQFKKYPGIYTPVNKKRRNRLLNDYFATPMGIELLEKNRAWRRENNRKHLNKEKGEDEDDDNDEEEDKDMRPLRPFFTDLPPSVQRVFEKADEAQAWELAKLGVKSPTGSAQSMRDPDSAEVRFQALNTRLRGELHHALNSEFLCSQIEDLDVCFAEMIKRASTLDSLVFRFRDGYGRLLCHGVAAYYQLVSESRQLSDEFTKITVVSFPQSKKDGVRVPNLPLLPLLHVLRGYRRKMPARHPLSASNSPNQESAQPEPISPLFLEENCTNGMFFPPPHFSLPSSAALPNQRPQVNTTICVTKRTDCLQIKVEDMEVYVPQLRIQEIDNATCENENEDHTLNFSFSMEKIGERENEFSSNLTFPLTATQRKKLKKAERVRTAARQASIQKDLIDESAAH